MYNHYLTIAPSYFFDLDRGDLLQVMSPGIWAAFYFGSSMKVQ